MHLEIIHGHIRNIINTNNNSNAYIKTMTNNNAFTEINKTNVSGNVCNSGILVIIIM